MSDSAALSLATIIPTFNEEANLEKLLMTLTKEGILSKDIHIADGGSEDHTESIAKKFKVNFIHTPQKGRAPQMNYVANLVKKDWLYFVHADTRPPIGFLEEITNSIHSGFQAGSFRSSFDSNHPLLSINAFFTRFNRLWCRGGDQTLFVKKCLFDELQGFCEKHIIMEDYDLIEKLQAKGKFDIMPKSAIISARKYENRSYWKVMRANYMAFKMYRQRMPSSEIRKVYLKMLE